MKIVWASHTSGLGGAELCFLEAAEALIGMGHEVHAVFPSDGDLLRSAGALGVRTHVTSYPAWVHTGILRRPIFYRTRRLLWHGRASVAIARMLSRLRPDLVVTNTMTIPAAALGAKIVRLPHVWYLHEFGQEDHGAIYDYGEHLSYRVMDWTTSLFLVNSMAVQRKYGSLFHADKLRLVPYAVEMRETPDPPPSSSRQGLRLVLVGELSPAKRQEDAIRAVAHLRTRGVAAELTLVGREKADYGAYLRSLIKRLGIEDSVNFVPYTNRPMLHLATADVALMCSRSEAFGRVTIEAMKLGKPVIGANCGATPELVVDGWNGLLYSAQDDVSLADKLAYLHHNRHLLGSMGKNAREWAGRTFTMQSYAKGLMEAFELVSQDPARSDETAARR